MAYPLHPPPDLSTFAGVREYLYSLKSHGAKYGIDRMRALAAELGHPERRFPVIHVAGTNGKGSTTAMLESIYRHAGMRTGMFTSPHLVYQGERIQVDRAILSHDAICAYVRALQPIAVRLAERDPDDHPSFFEFMTAIAFQHFAAEQVHVGLIETGLGGRLDATNIVQPEVSVITSISYDHCDILGHTLTEIAREKAGIIKAGRPVVIGRLPAEAEAVMRQRAQELGCPLFSVREVFGEDTSGYPQTRLEGDYQRWNAATATLAARVLAGTLPVSEAQIRLGLEQVNWAGRWETHRLADRTLILDATHNPEGAEQLEINLARLVHQTGHRPVVATGALGHARAQALLAVIARYASSIYLLRPKQPRACSLEELEAAVPADFSGPVYRATVEDLFPAAGQTRLGRAGETALVTGSIYLLGEVMEALYHPEGVGEQRLQD